MVELVGAVVVVAAPGAVVVAAAEPAEATAARIIVAARCCTPTPGTDRGRTEMARALASAAATDAPELDFGPIDRDGA